jgi:hypothetical protein
MLLDFRRLVMSVLIALAAVGFGGALFADPPAMTTPTPTTETIVLIRHGEKPPGGLGQLTPKGLNRALALPGILIGKYGKPNYIFAPNPSVKVDGGQYSYVRPITTIEPTAISLGMPVNTQIGYNDIVQLQAELTKPLYASSVLFVAWEHGYEDDFAKQMVKSYGGDPSIVPPWPDSDYDTIFVIRLTRVGTSTTETFTIDHEGLNGKLSNTLASPATSVPLDH